MPKILNFCTFKCSTIAGLIECVSETKAPLVEFAKNRIGNEPLKGVELSEDGKNVLIYCGDWVSDVTKIVPLSIDFSYPCDDFELQTADLLMKHYREVVFDPDFRRSYTALTMLPLDQKLWMIYKHRTGTYDSAYMPLGEVLYA